MTLYSPATKSGPPQELTQLTGMGQQQATQPNFSPPGGGGIQPPAPTQQPAPQWGQPPANQGAEYQQTPPKRSPYA